MMNNDAIMNERKWQMQKEQERFEVEIEKQKRISKIEALAFERRKNAECQKYELENVKMMMEIMQRHDLVDDRTKSLMGDYVSSVMFALIKKGNGVRSDAQSNDESARHFSCVEEFIGEMIENCKRCPGGMTVLKDMINNPQ